VVVGQLSAREREDDAALDQGLLPFHAGQALEEPRRDVAAAEALHDVTAPDAVQEPMVVADAVASGELLRTEFLSPSLAVSQQGRNPPDTPRGQPVHQGVEKCPADAFGPRVRQHPEPQDPRVVLLQVGYDRTGQRAIPLGDQRDVIGG
jgi:hypothetical protein